MERDGVARVRAGDIAAKYGEAAWSFEAAYGWMRCQLAACVERPEGAVSPYWLYRDLQWGAMGEDCVALRLAVPAERCVVFDLRLWTRILGLEYLGADEPDERRFAAELARQGVTSVAAAFSSPFFPIVRQQVERSWERLCESSEGCGQTYLQGAVWELRQEWVLERRVPQPPI